MFYIINMMNAILKGAIYVASVVVLLSTIQKVYKLYLFKTTQAERIKEIGSIWINALCLLLISNFTTLAAWLSTSDVFEIITVTMIAVFVMSLPIIYLYTKYSDIQAEEKEDELLNEDIISNKIENDDIEKINEDEEIRAEEVQEQPIELSCNGEEVKIEE